MRYPVTLTPDSNGTMLATFPDVPGANTYGDTREDALERALDALLTMFDACMRDRRDIPEPSARKGPAVELPALEAAKVLLYRQMRAKRINKSELARLLDWHLPQVDRVLNVRHGSQIDQMEAAFGALGQRMSITITDVGPRRRVPGAIIAKAQARSRAGSRKHAAKKR